MSAHEAERQIRFLEVRLAAERERRKRAEAGWAEAERQTKRFHALLLAERIRKIQKGEG